MKDRDGLLETIDVGLSRGRDEGGDVVVAGVEGLEEDSRGRSGEGGQVGFGEEVKVSSPGFGELTGRTGRSDEG